jgi:hypothetical protein
MLSVAIAVEVPGETGIAAPIVSTSCEAAVGAGRCPIARSLEPSSIVAWYAVVRSDDATGTRMKVELRDRSATGVLIETRDLVFAEHDKSESRWASVGAVIAALVAARDSTERVPVAPRAAEVPPPPVVEARPAPWAVDLLAVTGPALDRSPFRWGGALRGFVGFPRAPAAIGTVSLRYAQRAGDLDLTWVSGSAGIGARVGDGDSPIGFDFTGELVYERMSITGRDAATGREESSQENRFGGRLAVHSAVRIWQSLAFVVGGDVSALRPAVDITLLDVRAGREPSIAFAASAGVRWSR